MDYDVIVIGGGLSGLTAASLLAKRGKKVAVVDKNYMPGGSCGIFKRKDCTFDQGSAMLFGFGEKGFNSHRFVFNALEEPIDVIRHVSMYKMEFDGRPVEFYADIDRFVKELAALSPKDEKQIEKFYRDLSTMYQHVMVEVPVFTTPDETKKEEMLPQIKKHPLSYIKFLRYLNMSTEKLLKKYFKNPEIFQFFDKLTSTYCYTNVAETPAVLAAVMFIDNHVGGTYYPAGSTLQLPGKLEKVIEENDGDMLLEQEAVQILFDSGGKPYGVLLKNGEEVTADDIVYSGTVWNLYEKLIGEANLTEKEIAWERAQKPTAPSAVCYACVESSAIPEDTLPVEMMAPNPERLDEDEITVYIMSIDDHTLCGENSHAVIAIGPTFEHWEKDAPDYEEKKERLKARFLEVLERRFPGFSEKVTYCSVATPVTIERYTNKNGGAVAGPKQMMGQHMFNRLKTRTKWDNLFCCGESTVMGTGTPTVTVSGIAAANAILSKYKLKEYAYEEGMKNYVNEMTRPVEKENLFPGLSEKERDLALLSMECQYCEKPSCMKNKRGPDIRGMMRRISVGNIAGAKKLLRACNQNELEQAREKERDCVRGQWAQPVQIGRIIESLTDQRDFR